MTVPQAIEPVIRRLDLMEGQLVGQLDAAEARLQQTANPRPSVRFLVFTVAFFAILTLVVVVAVR